MKPNFTTRTLLLASLAVAVPAAAMAQGSWRANQLTFTAPAALTTIDNLKGQPARLAWSPDGSELYVQALEGEFGKPGGTLHHYVISAANGRTRGVGAEPAWAAAYWEAKRAQASPDDAAFKIEPKSETRQARTTSVPTGGDLARGGTVGADVMGTSNDDAASAAFNSQTVVINTMVLKGETIGRFENTVIVPGLTFGWGPKGSNVIAYAATNGRVVVMDATGAKQDVTGSKSAVLPAWSADGSKLAWLQKDGRKKVVLQVSGVSGS